MLCARRLRPRDHRVLRAHRVPGEDGLAAADRGRRAAVPGADSGRRPRGQRQPPLDAPGRFQLPGVRTGARAGADLHRELRRAPRGGAARDRRWVSSSRSACWSFMALLLLAEPDFGAASVLFITGFGLLFLAGARLRCVLAAAVLGAGAMALLVMLVPYRMARVTSFLDPWARSVQQRLPAHAVADRHRARRVVRRRPRRERAEAVLSARGAHRLPVRGAGRGAGPGRRRG